MSLQRRISSSLLLMVLTGAPALAGTATLGSVHGISVSRAALELPALAPVGAGPTVFVDLTKQATPWTSDRALALDRLGYVRSLSTGQVAESVLFANAPHTGGDYVLLYRGNGALAMSGAQTLSRAPGRMLVRVPSGSQAVTLRLTATDPSDYVTGVHFVPLAAEHTFATAPIAPSFVRALRGYGMLRFGEWMHASTFAESAVSVTRPTTSVYSQAAAAGVAAEYATALANAVGADPWFALPAGATDGYVYAFADAVHRQLDPRLHAAFEYGDQVWRTGTPANGWAVMAGHSFALPGNEQQAALEWYARRSTQVFRIAQRAFGTGAERVIRVLSGPPGDDASLAAILAFAGAGAHTDAFYVSSQPTPTVAARIAATGLSQLYAGSAAPRSGARVTPNPTLAFVPSDPSDEVVEDAPGPRPAHRVPPPDRPIVPLAPKRAGPELLGQSGDPLPNVDLSREGRADWVHWNGGALERKASPLEQIGNASSIGGERTSAGTVPFVRFAWHDGTSGAGSGVHSGAFVSGPGRGFAFDVPADTTERVLRVYVGARSAQGRFLAELSDGSAPRYLDATLDAETGSRSAVYTLVYRASRAGERLRVTYQVARAYAADGRAYLEAAALSREGQRPSGPPADMTTFHNDNARDGWDQNEFDLTVSSVGSSKFGMLQTIDVDGVVLAQPLYLGQYSFPSQGTHNVLIVATENDTLYEFDADTYQLINSRSFGTAQNSNDVGCGDIEPTYGITSTPVIERSTDTIYLVAATEPSSNQFVATLHAVDIGTLADQQAPVNITASVKMSNGKTLSFDPQNQQSRTSLAYNNGSIYVGIGSHCDNAAHSIVGWMLQYNTALQQVASLATAEDTTGYLLDSIWMTGYASAIDATGNVYSVTGNGAFDAKTGGHNYGESAIKLDSGLTGVQSYFTPKNWKTLNKGDVDFGSGGIMLLPTQQAQTPDVAVAMGKDSTLYLLDTDNLGGLAKPLHQYSAGGNGVWGGPTFFSSSAGQYVYYQTDSDVLKAYKVKTTKKGSVTLVNGTQGSSDAGYGGSSPVLSSDGQMSNSAIVWLVQRKKTLSLQAYEASDLTHMLFSAKAGTWANPENNGFVTPLVANGKVYVPATGTVTVFGLQQ